MGVLPHSPAAEHELVAAVLVDHHVLGDVADVVSADDFHNHNLGIIWEAMRVVVKRDGALDPPLLFDYLKQRRLWDRVGGHDAFAQLGDRGGHTSRVGSYAREIRSFARQRSVVAAAESIAAEGMRMDIDDVDQFCLDAEDQVRAAAAGREAHQFIDPGEAVAQVVERATTRPEPGDTTRGIPVGLPTLDHQICHGGLPRGLVVIGARPKMGKTNMGAQFALSMMQGGHAGVFFSLEMTGVGITTRMVANAGQLNSKKILGETPITNEEDLRCLTTGADEVARLSTMFKIDESSRLTAGAIRSRIGRAERELGKKVEWAVVDYFNIMAHPGIERMREDQAMGISCGILADVAKERNMVIILLTQLSRKCESKLDKRPELHHLKECGALEQDASLVVFPFWPHWYGKQGVPAYTDKSRYPESRAELMVAANRFGATGIIPLEFWPGQHRYREGKAFDELYG